MPQRRHKSRAWRQARTEEARWSTRNREAAARSSRRRCTSSQPPPVFATTKSKEATRTSMTDPMEAATTSERSSARGALTSTSGAPLSSSGTAPVLATSSAGTDGASPIRAARSPNCRSASSSAVRRPRRAPRRAARVATALLPAPPLPLTTVSRKPARFSSGVFAVVRACRTPSESGSASATDSPSPLSPSMLRAASFSKCSPSSAGDTMPSSSAARAREVTDPVRSAVTR